MVHIGAKKLVKWDFVRPCTLTDNLIKHLFADSQIYRKGKRFFQSLFQFTDKEQFYLVALQSQLLTSLPVSSEWNANSAIMATVWFWRYPLCWQGIICILLQSQARSLGHCWVDKSHQGIYTAKGPLRPHRNHTPCVLGTDKGDWVEGVTGGCLGKKRKEKH